MPVTVDVCVLGGGPGGYVAALRAAALGASVALVEADSVGGVCLVRGCVPSKAMLRSAEVYHLAVNAKAFGVTVSGVQADYPAIRARKDRIVGQLVRGVHGLLDAAGVTLVKGYGRLASPGVVEVDWGGGGDLLLASQIIVASGSSSVMPPVPGTELPGVIDSDGAFALEEVPKRIVVAGAGAVGVEWATLFALLGSDVTLVEMLPSVVPNEDADVSKALRRILLQQGVKVHTGTRIDSISKRRGGLRATLAQNDDASEVSATHVLMATGRRANVENLGLASAGVAYTRDGIPVDGCMRTNQPNVFAVGDVTGNRLLAHVASHQGVVAAENATGGSSVYHDGAVPACTFTHPEIASVGLTEADARQQHGEVIVGRFPFQALGRARAFGDTDGFVKVVAGAARQELLGMHVIGPGASDLVAEGALAIQLEATLGDLRETIHAHPTFPEATAEAAWAAINQPIHMPLQRVRAKASE